MKQSPHNPKRVLHIVSAMNRGGAETLLMNVYRNLDRTKLQFDFVSHSPDVADYDNEIRALGGRVYHIPSLGQLGPIGYIKKLKEICSSYPYEAVHAHTDYQGGFPALAARLSGINKRICHSHSSSWLLGNDMKAKLTLTMLQGVMRIAVTEYCACSTEAASFLFGKRLADKGKVRVLKNGIDWSPKRESHEQCAASLKQEFGLPSDAKIIGHVGKFSESKNHRFIVKLLRRLLEMDRSYYVVLVGNGPLRSEIEELAIQAGVDDHIRFVGVRDDIPRLMEAFDCFIFPSLFEGFGMVAVEAQSAGTPCVVSANVPRSTDLGLGLISYVSLNDHLDRWRVQIEKALVKRRPERGMVEEALGRSGFHIKDSIPEWLSLYGLA